MKQTHSPPGSASWPQYLTHRPVWGEERPSWPSAPATIIVTHRSQWHLLPPSVCCGTWEPGSFLKRTCRYAEGGLLLLRTLFGPKRFTFLFQRFVLLNVPIPLKSSQTPTHTNQIYLLHTVLYYLFFFMRSLVAHWPFVASALVNRPSVERVFFVLFLQISASEFQTLNTFWKGNILFLFIAKSAASWGRESPCRYFFGGVSLLRLWLFCNRRWSLH